jgi:hypothetical protein
VRAGGSRSLFPALSWPQPVEAPPVRNVRGGCERARHRLCRSTRPVASPVSPASAKDVRVCAHRTVDVAHGHRDGGVPEPRLQPPRVHPEASGVRGEGVAGRMPAALPQSGLLAHAIDAVLERRLRMDGESRCIATMPGTLPLTVQNRPPRPPCRGWESRLAGRWVGLGQCSRHSPCTRSSCRRSTGSARLGNRRSWCPRRRGHRSPSRRWSRYPPGRPRLRRRRVQGSTSRRPSESAGPDTRRPGSWPHTWSPPG